MSSGYGLSGAPNRCYGEWQRYLECYTSEGTTAKEQCSPSLEDFFECLHHRKERARVLLIKQEIKRKGLQTYQELKSPVEVLGLVEGKKDSK